MKSAARTLVVILAWAAPAVGADQFDRALERAIAHIQARPDLTDAEKAKAKLDAMGKARR